MLFARLFLLTLLFTTSLFQAQAQRRDKPSGPVLAAGPLAFQTSDSVQLFVKISGRGVPCLVVHGGPGAGSYGLEHLGLAPLESSLQLIYLDQRGSGRSASSPRRSYALAR